MRALCFQPCFIPQETPLSTVHARIRLCITCALLSTCLRPCKHLPLEVQCFHEAQPTTATAHASPGSRLQLSSLQHTAGVRLTIAAGVRTHCQHPCQAHAWLQGKERYAEDHGHSNCPAASMSCHEQDASGKCAAGKRLRTSTLQCCLAGVRQQSLPAAGLPVQLSLQPWWLSEVQRLHTAQC